MKLIAQGKATNDRIFYTNGPGMISDIIDRDANGSQYWYHYDRLGNVAAVTHSYGDPAAIYTMEAFGNVLQMADCGDFSSELASDIQPYHLTTKEYDPDSALYYFAARWYDRSSARFLSRDIVALPGDNCYPYSDNNPVNWTDPTGTQSIPWLPPLPAGLCLRLVLGWGCGLFAAVIIIYCASRKGRGWWEKGREGGVYCGELALQYAARPTVKDFCRKCCWWYFNKQNWPDPTGRGLKRCLSCCVAMYLHPGYECQ